jgi:hypothetical protein
MINRIIGAHIRVALDLITVGIPVLGDEVQIEIAVLNLALNARDAMPEGGTMTISPHPLRIERDPELAEGEYVDLRSRTRAWACRPTWRRALSIRSSPPGWEGNLPWTEPGLWSRAAGRRRRAHRKPCRPGDDGPSAAAPNRRP